MRFLMLYRPDKNQQELCAPDPEHMAQMGKLIDEMTREGVLLGTDALLPTAMGARVRRAGAELTVSDGALPDMKDPMVGYALIRAASKEEAIAGAKRFLQVAGEGYCEVLPLMDGPPPS
ncbi:YciI family protein [Sorangium sp. So ce381]|uniref:YciI family protein n=1 Tax=Sorangium sp. So ce381 TaxID=3133307 RepID=UPI003F5BDE68